MLLLALLGKNSKLYEKCVLQAIRMIILQQKLSFSFVFVELAVYIHRLELWFCSVLLPGLVRLEPGSCCFS